MNHSEIPYFEKVSQIAQMLGKEIEGIDLVIAYGSLAREDADELSDFDILVISKTKRVSGSFIWNKRPVKIRTLTWEETERLAKGLYGNWCVGASIFEHAKILWSRSEERVKQFYEFAVSVEAGSQAVLHTIVSKFHLIYGHLWRLQDAVKRNDTLSPSCIVWDIANSLVEVLAALNRKPLVHNWGKQQDEIVQLEIKPKDFVSRFNRLMICNTEDLLPIATALVKDVHELVKSWFQNQSVMSVNFIREVEGEWDGTLDCLNKVRSAAKLEDLVAARYAAQEFVEFAIWIFLGLRGKKSDIRHFEFIPESIVTLPSEHQIVLGTLLQSSDFERLVDAATKLVRILQSEALKAGAKLPIVSSLTEAKEFLRVSNMS